MDSINAVIPYNRTENISTNTTISSRNLISAYIAKTCPPPAMLTPLNPAYELPSSDAQMELAYKHPQLLFGIEVDEKNDEPKIKDISYETNREIEVKYVNNSPGGGRRKCCFDSTGHSNQCRLLEKVNTDIAKAWNQINSSVPTAAATDSTSRHILSRSVSNNSDESEKILFYQPVHENEANFHVNKITYSDEEDEEDESSYNFYDSIDDTARRDDNNKKNHNNNFDNIVSICHQEAGEEMAEIDSYERRKYYWSLDSGFK